MKCLERIFYAVYIMPEKKNKLGSPKTEKTEMFGQNAKKKIGCAGPFDHGRIIPGLFLNKILAKTVY